MKSFEEDKRWFGESPRGCWLAGRNGPAWVSDEERDLDFEVILGWKQRMVSAKRLYRVVQLPNQLYASLAWVPSRAMPKVSHFFM
jgi:hypothetical protein